MSEIDKLINRAFPDELRNVEPVDVDEDAILSLTLEKLGLGPDLTDGPAEDEPGKPARTRKAPKPEKELKLVEAPVVVVKHPWLNWAGWAVAACLMLAFVANWGPWLIANLGFGTQPQTPGESSGYVDEYVQDRSSDRDNAVIPQVTPPPEDVPPEPTVQPDNSMILGKTSPVHVILYDVSYGENFETITLTLEFQSEEALDMDEFDLKLKSEDYLDNGDNGLERVMRSNEGSQVTLTYKFKEVSYLPTELLLTVRRQVPTTNADSFSYQDVVTLTLYLNEGYATTNLQNGGVFTFDSILEATPGATPEPAE